MIATHFMHSLLIACLWGCCFLLTLVVYPLKPPHAFSNVVFSLLIGFQISIKLLFAIINLCPIVDK